MASVEIALTVVPVETAFSAFSTVGFHQHSRPERLDYRYVTPSTTIDSSTGDIGRAHRNAAFTSDFSR